VPGEICRNLYAFNIIITFAAVEIFFNNNFLARIVNVGEFGTRTIEVLVENSFYLHGI